MRDGWCGNIESLSSNCGARSPPNLLLTSSYPPSLAATRPLPAQVGEALGANGVQFASLAGANPMQREAALHAFLHDPECAVLTVRGEMNTKTLASVIA